MTMAITIIHLIVSLIIILVVLFQSGKTSGLSGAIGGGSETYLSRNKSKSLDSRLAKATKWFGLAFWVLTLILNIIA
ncbi:MAG: preprotein translocase subunit SecG [Oscillospiraceae bacterium]|jgi:preprotein translocase subunit SecG|nr:preprotein translocase subunit SecG [Oscillospiraceae bacterium]MBQ8930278.1 preprotein translocase subunit SecG [Oscillospiraceae bacterium]MBR6429960.1 preprotein translocase subunit SecG [Oscillospiraceae bacterium]